MAQIGIWEVIGLLAGSSLLSAIFNNGVTGLARWRSRKEDGNFGRLYLALSLEEYAASCSDTISESETYDSSDQSSGSPQVNIPPLPPFPLNVDWKALGLDETNRLMSFRVEVESLRAQLRDCLEHDVDGAVEDTRTFAANMGLKAIGIAHGLRARATAPMPPTELNWSPAEHLESKRDEYKKVISARAASVREATPLL